MSFVPNVNANDEDEDEDDNSLLNAITRLERHENFDNNLEDIHAALSKRDSIRQSLTSSIISARRKDNNTTKEKDDVKDENRRSVDKAYKHSSRRLLSKIEKDKQPQRQRNNSHHQHQHRRSSASESSSRNLNGEHRRHRQSRRRIYQQEDPQKCDLSDEQPVRTDSVIEKLLQYDGGSDDSVTKDDKINSNKNFLSNQSTSRDINQTGTSRKKSLGRRRRSQSRARSTSVSPIPFKEDDPQQEIRHKNRRRGSYRQHSQQESRNQHRRRSSSQQPQQVQKLRDDDNQSSQVHHHSRMSKSLRFFPSHNHNHEQQQQQQIHGGKTEENKIKQFFENNEEREISSKQNDGLDSNQQFHSINSISKNDDDNTNKTMSNSVCKSLTSSQGCSEKVKKTKLQKIHELLAKCDRYKKEWKDMVVELRKCRRVLEDTRAKVVSLEKNVEANEREITILQTRLSETLDELETTKIQQRTELSDTANDLASANIDHEKTVDEARTLKVEIKRIKEVLVDRDGTISTLEEELRISVESTNHLESDVLYADDQIIKLENDMKILENEVTAYREAAERDYTSDANGNTNGENLREVMNEATKRCFEEKERNLDEKRRMLEEQIEEFEEKRRSHLEEQEQKEQIENEKQKIYVEERRESEEKIGHRLKTIEDENTALNGRLKSQQLDSTMKFKNKDNSIIELQSKLDRLTSEQQERDNAPDSSSSLLQEIESLKANADVSRTDFEVSQMKKIELQNEVNDLQLANKEIMACMSVLQLEIADQKKEVDSQKRKTMEWQKKSGEWSDKAFKWKEKAELFENKAKDSNTSSRSGRSADTSQAEPQALFLAAAVEKQATTTANGNGSTWRLGGIFTKSSENEDETQALISELENENSKQEMEMKTLKSEMVKMQSKYKEQAYIKEQQFDQLLKEKEDIELINVNFLKELELARKLNQTISNSDE
mmetsp:Transcript_32064/g.36005  ORF Transcript_32064/g.36005 Transcript_32064/m.36005 type:complete len:948 (+) Transcript_32064:122-2965(+)